MKRHQIVVIAIEDRQWHWAFFQAGGRGLEPRQAGVTPRPASPSTDATALDDAWRDALLAQWREQRIAFEGARLFLGMAATDAITRVIDLPTSDPDEVREMCGLQIEKISPYSADETTVAHEILAVHGDGCRALAAGLGTERVERFGSLFRKAGLKPERVDLILSARWAALAAEATTAADGSERVAHLIWRDDACDLVMVQSGEPILFRSLARRDGLPDAAYAADIAEQTAYSMAACDLEQGPVAATTPLVWHSGDDPPEELTPALGAAGINGGRLMPLPAAGQLCQALARRGVENGSRHMNLAPPTWRKADIDRSRRRRLMLTLGTAAALWIVTVGALFGRLRIDRHRLEQADRQYAALSNRFERVVSISNRVHNLTQYTDQSGSSLEALREISARQPRGIDLLSFDYRKGLMIRLAGDAQNAALIYDFKNEIDASPLFAGTDPPSIARSARGDRETFRMNINFPATGSLTDSTSP